MLTHGDVRHQLAEDLNRSLAEVMARKAAAGVRNYYILVAAIVRGGDIGTRLILLKQRPPRMLGAILYRVQDGVLYREWVLPKDIPVPGELDPDSVNPQILKAAAGLPIVY